MQIQIRWKGCEKSQSAENKLNEGLFELEEKYAFLEPTVKAEIVSYKNDAATPFKARITLFGKNKATLRAEFAAKDINSAINGSLEKLDDQCRRIKVKKQNHDDKEGTKVFQK